MSQPSLRKNLYWNTLLRIPVRIITFIFSIIVARILDPSDFGILAIAMMCIGYANIFTNFGLNEAIIQRSITCDKTINAIFTVDIIISTLLALIFAAGAGIIANFFHEPRSKSVIMVMSMVFVISSFYSIPHTLLRRDSNFQVFSVLEMAKNMTTSLLTLLLAFFHFGYWSLAYGQLLPLLIFTIIICVKTRWKPKFTFQFNLLSPIVHFGGWNFLKTQTTFLLSEVEKIVIGRMLGSYSLGIYDKAKSIAVVPAESVFMNINSVMFSYFSKNKYDVKMLHEHYAKSIALISIISFPVYLGSIVIAPYFVPVLLGEKWIEMVLPFQIVLTGYLFKSFGGMLTGYNIAVGRYKQQTLLTIASSFTLIILCVWLIRYGLVGVSIAFLTFCLVEFVLYMSLSFLTLNINCTSIARFIFSGAWSSIVMFIAVTCLAYKYFSTKNIYNMVVLVFIGVLVYMLCVFIDNSKYSFEFKNKILQDFSKLIAKKTRQ